MSAEKSIKAITLNSLFIEISWDSVYSWRATRQQPGTLSILFSLRFLGTR